MKRGLVVLDPAEVSPQERTGRVAALQTRQAADGLSLALVYGDVHRSDDIAYLSNLCIYWNEGILAVPAHGEPTFLTKLSPRVHPWMRRSSTLDDLHSGKSFAALVAGLVEGLDPGVVGLVDAALWPAEVIEEVRAATPGWEVRELGGVVRELRIRPSDAELALLQDAAGHLRAALDDAAEPALPDGERLAVVESALRGAGHTDVLAEIGHGPDGVTSVEVSSQYRFGWVRAGRLVAGGPAWADSLRAAGEAACSAITPGVPAAVPIAAAEGHLSDLPPGALARIGCVHQADLSTGGDYVDGAATVLAPGAVVSVLVEVMFADGGRVCVGDMVRVDPGGAVAMGTGTATRGNG